MKVDIPYECMQEITTYTLKEDYDSLKEDYDLLLDMHGNDFLPVFSTDAEVEAQKLKKLVKAYKTVLSYYGVTL